MEIYCIKWPWIVIYVKRHDIQSQGCPMLQYGLGEVSHFHWFAKHWYKFGYFTWADSLLTPKCWLFSNVTKNNETFAFAFFVRSLAEWLRIVIFSIMAWMYHFVFEVYWVKLQKWFVGTIQSTVTGVCLASLKITHFEISMKIQSHRTKPAPISAEFIMHYRSSNSTKVQYK